MRDHILTEILSQPRVWRRVLGSLFGRDTPLGWLDSLIGDGPVLFTGMGSSYYLSLAMAPSWRHYVGGQALAVSASEVITHPRGRLLQEARGTVIGVSRSGKTIETREAVRRLRREFGWRAVGVTCHDGSRLAKECEGSLVLAAAAEKSRFTTRALTTTVLALQALAAVKSGNRRLEGELRRLPDLAEGLLERYGKLIEDRAARGGYDRFVFLGQGSYLGFARELALKTEEIVRAPAEAHETLEYLHGQKYAANASTLITVLLSDSGARYQAEALAKIMRVGARVAVIGEKAARGTAAGADLVIELRSGLSEHGRMLLTMPLAQLFIYHRAVAAGRSAWIRRMVTRT